MESLLEIYIKVSNYLYDNLFQLIAILFWIQFVVSGKAMQKEGYQPVGVIVFLRRVLFRMLGTLLYGLMVIGLLVLVFVALGFDFKRY